MDRVLHVLMGLLPGNLAELADTNLYLPAPEAKDYYSIPQDPDQVIQNHNVAVFIYPAGPRTEVATGSGGGGVGQMEFREFPLDVTLVCRRAMYDPVNKPVLGANGKHLIHDEVLRRRAERYTGAIIKSVLEGACCGESGIIHVSLADDMADIFFDEKSEKPLWGIASAQFILQQKVSLPFRRGL